MSTLGIGESCPRNAASIFEKGAFLIWFDDLFSVCYYLQCFKIILIFNTELIFAQDEDGLIIHLSLRTVVSKNQQLHSCDFAVCLLEGMCGIETVKS